MTKKAASAVRRKSDPMDARQQRFTLEQAFREALDKRLRAAVLADLIEEAHVTQTMCAPDERPLMTAYHDALQLLAAGGAA